MAADAAAALDAVLATNDGYLEGIVERWDICPFAKRCRQDGRLWRSVVWAREPEDAITRMGRALDALEAHDAEALPEVALLIAPALAVDDPAAFAAVHAAVREAYQERLAQPSFYVVAFHPELPLDARSAGSLVHFWRRSPHPTLQLVNVGLLQRLRRVDQAHDPNRLALQLAASGLPPESILEALEAQRPHQPVSERVAADNAETFARIGPAPFEQVQQTLAARTSDDAARHGPWDPAWPDSPWAPTALSPA